MLVKFLTITSAVLPMFFGTAFAADWRKEALTKAVDFHTSNRPEICNKPDDASTDPISFEMKIGEETASLAALLVEFPCRAGAYNSTAVYLLSDEHGKMSEVFFPSPKIDVTYLGEGENAPVKDIVITETRSLREVINPTYDADRRTMTERNKWRGVGDAYTLIEWGFKNGKFELMHLSVDASYDGKDDPQTLIERDIWKESDK